MRELFKTAGGVQAFCREHGWEFCFIGGLAVWRWGKPRFTQDVDLTLLAGFRDEEKIVDAFAKIAKHFLIGVPGKCAHKAIRSYVA